MAIILMSGVFALAQRHIKLLFERPSFNSAHGKGGMSLMTCHSNRNTQKVLGARAIWRQNISGYCPFKDIIGFAKLNAMTKDLKYIRAKYIRAKYVRLASWECVKSTT